ncbi:MAG: helix-turn-helix domain-containing protein [Verrucomicrobia bacterium]|nr:helix-turn-helix domain-containing protein [Verrucomicrobiota bacterium]
MRRGWSIRKVARYVGVSPGTVCKWVKKAKRYGHHDNPDALVPSQASPEAALRRARLEDLPQADHAEAQRGSSAGRTGARRRHSLAFVGEAHA